MKLYTYLFRISFLSLIFFSINIAKAQMEDQDEVQETEEKNILIPENVKNQTDLAKYQIIEYVKKFPHSLYQCALYISRLSTFQQLLNSEGPKSFQNAFKLNSQKRLPLTENQFPFDNAEVGDVCDHRYGYCHGYTTSLTYWNRLAHFDPENINQANYPKDIGSDDWFDYYKLIIDELMKKRNPVIIPGFHHLYEFVDSHPRITRYIKEHIAIKWAERNINISSYFGVLNGVYNKFTNIEALKLHQNLSFRINDLKFNPIVWIASPSDTEKKIFGINEEAGIHNMQAYKITPIDRNGDYKIYFWDIYSPHDAQSAWRVYTISTRKKNDNGAAKIFLHKENLKNIPITTKIEVNSDDGFADMDTVPFDDINIGEDARKLFAFYQKNEKFTKYLEQKYQDNIKNPQPAFRAPYRGEDKSKFEIILADESVWEVPAKYQYFDGNLWIEKNQIKELSSLVIKSLDLLTNKSWRKGNKFPRTEFQKPEPFIYNDSSGKNMVFNFKIEWLNFKGEFLPNDDFYNIAPYQLINKIKEYTLKWPITKPINFKYFSDTKKKSRELIGDKNEILWVAPIEFIKDGLFYIPQNLQIHVPAKVTSYLKRNNLWPINTPVNMEILSPVQRTVEYGMEEKYIFPIDWFVNNSKEINITPERYELLPDALKTYITGFKNLELNKPVKIYLDSISYNIVRRDKEKYLIPLTWNKHYQKLDPSIITFNNIPNEEIPHIPLNYRNLLVGENGTWPPKNLVYTKYSPELRLKDGSSYYWPLTWVNDRLNLVIPKGEENVIPKNVIDELFTTGPYIWPFKNQSIDVFRIQLPIIYLEDGSIWLWPRDWMTTNYGMIKLPKSDQVVNKNVPREIQNSIKKAYGGKYPADRKVNVWIINSMDGN